LGSGTTAIAALSLNRQVIGFEIKPEYCEIATQRIQNYLEEINFIQTSLLPLIYN
jgi:adenine-specific DNA-methyltransferase